MPYLIDNSVIHGLINTSDKHHSVCKKFFDNNENTDMFFSTHSLFEFQSSVARRLKEGTFTKIGENHLKRVTFFNVDINFYEECIKQKLFDTFSKLRGMDLIYACMAKAFDLTLVTCDSHFDTYSNKIKLLKLL